MTRQVCIPYAIAVRHAIEDVGKIVASSKQRYTWEFKFPGTSASNFITMTWSGSNVKVFEWRADFYEPRPRSFVGTVFEHIFPVKNVEYRLSIERALPDSKTARDGGVAGNGAIAKLWVEVPCSRIFQNHSESTIWNTPKNSFVIFEGVLEAQSAYVLCSCGVWEYFCLMLPRECHSNQYFIW